MKIQNKNKTDDLDSISKWLLATFPKLKNKPLSIEVNQLGKVNSIETPVNLTIGDMNKIIDKFPELA